MNIQELIKQPEGPTLELRKDIPTRQEIAKIVCAFSNLSGGELIIGFDSRANEIIGVDKKSLFEVQSELKTIISTAVEPLPAFFIKTLNHEDKKLINVTILPGNLKPYILKGLDKLKGTYVRIGKHNQLATPAIIAELERSSASVSFDSTPAYDTDIDDLNKKLIEEYSDKKEMLTGASKSLINYAFLEKNQLIYREGSKVYPTVAAILLFSDKVNNYFQKAKIRCKVYEYEDRSKLVDIKTFSGTLIKQYSNVINYFNDVDFSADVLKELVLNAVLHRDYSNFQDTISISVFSDRMEIVSPGFLPVGLTLDDINNGVSLYRNPIIYRIFNEMGFGYQNGSGLQNVNKNLMENNLKSLVFDSSYNNFIVHAYNEPSEDYFTREDLKVIEYLEKNEFINNNKC
ncbi:MAG: ATP-binding protein, partial [Cyanobacteriota bacterium]